MALRRLGNDEVNESYIYFCESFLKCIVGCQTFNRKWNLNMKLSEIATPSDEALGLLLLENSEYKWLCDCETPGNSTNNKEESNNITKTKYTSAGKQKEQKKGFTKRYGGWKNEGIQRFNKIMEMVKADRVRNGKWFDEIMMNRRQKDANRKKDSDVDESGWATADNDLFDDVDMDDGEQEATTLSSSMDELADEDDQENYNKVQNSAEV